MGRISHSQIELVDFLKNGDQEHHDRLITLFDLHVIGNSLPITINIHSELLVSKVVNFVAWVLVLESIGIGDQRLLVDKVKILYCIVLAVHFLLNLLDFLSQFFHVHIKGFCVG